MNQTNNYINIDNEQDLLYDEAKAKELIEMCEKAIEGVTNEREKNYAVATMLAMLVKVNLINPVIVSNDNVKEIYVALTSSTKLNKQTKKIIEELQLLIPK